MLDGKKMSKILDSEEIIIYSTESLDIINDSIVDHTLKKLDEYRKLFRKDRLEKFKVKLYDNLESFQEDYRSIRNVELPEYSRGWINNEDASIYICMNLEALKRFKDNSLFWDKRVSCVGHELFHCYYCLYYYGSSRITWFDEGMAQYLSGETTSYKEYDWYNLFRNFADKYKNIDNLNERRNGNSHVPDNLIFQRQDVFDGYAASLLAIKYLFETKGACYVLDIMFDNSRIIEEGQNILSRMISYFNRGCQEQPQIKKS